MKNQTELIENFLRNLNTEVEILEYINVEDIDQDNAYDSIFEAIADNNGFDQEVVYYSNAIKYLRENDPSLKESLEIAIEYGFELKNLTSEVLASLLKTENVMIKFSELEYKITDFFNNL
jgi:hypothetical protein